MLNLKQSVCTQDILGQRRAPRSSIVQSTTYCFDSTDHIAALFDMPTEYMYSRFANPTCDAVEKKIAALEGGVGAMLTSSGQAASLLSILNLCHAGDSFIAASTIYGGTVNLFAVTLKKLGIECIWVDSSASEEEIQAALSPIQRRYLAKHWPIRLWLFSILKNLLALRTKMEYRSLLIIRLQRRISAGRSNLARIS